MQDVGTILCILVPLIIRMRDTLTEKINNNQEKENLLSRVQDFIFDTLYCSSPGRCAGGLDAAGYFLLHRIRSARVFERLNKLGFVMRHSDAILIKTKDIGYRYGDDWFPCGAILEYLGGIDMAGQLVQDKRDHAGIESSSIRG